MKAEQPLSHFIGGDPLLHYLEWNPQGSVAIVLLHGGSANAWWWQPLAQGMAKDYRLLALDQRGHGDSAWVRPPAYAPRDYARDLQRLIERLRLRAPVVVGHSMGGINALAHASTYPESLRAAVALDVAVTSTHGRDRYLRRLKALPTVEYPDLKTAKERFRLMPREGNIPAATLRMIAEHSLRRTEEGRFTFKFDRDSFFGSDGIDVVSAIARIKVPLLLVRGELSKIMTAEAARHVADSNSRVRVVEIPGVHHHLLLERPDLVARVLTDFIRNLGA